MAPTSGGIIFRNKSAHDYYMYTVA